MAKGICKVEGCGRPAWSRGWCNSHYTRWRSAGDPGPAEFRRRGGSDVKCEFPGCERRHEAQGLCPGHLYQQKKGRPLVALAQRLKTTDRDEQGRKLCRLCGEWLSEESFYVNPKPKDGLHNRCIRCARDEKLFRDYGITTEDYEALLDQQGHACKICRRPEQTGKQLSIDHDHACCPGRKSCGKCIRGLLCNRCNMGIGYLGEDVARLRAAVDYLTRDYAD